MRTTSKIAGAAIAAALMLTGCGAAAPEQQEGEETRQEAGTETGGELFEPAGPETDISADDGQTIYLYAQQAFSPKLVRWEVGEDMAELTYRTYDCLGGIEAEGFATLEPREDPGAWEATWITPNPMRGTRSTFIRLAINDRTLGAQHSNQEIATTFHDSVLRDFNDMCVKVGKTVARFVLP